MYLMGPATDVSVDISVNTRLSIGGVSTEFWSVLGLISVVISIEYQAIYWPIPLSVDIVGIHRYFTNSYRSIVSSIGRYISRYIGLDIGRYIFQKDRKG